MISVIVLVLFLLILIAIGIWSMKKTKNLDDFFLGGRSIGPWISAFAYGTTYFSAVLFIGFAGSLGWAFGINALWIAAGNTVFGALLAWIVLAKRTRIMTKKLEVMTMPEFLQERYDAKYLKIISALIIFIFLLPYSASVFKGLGHLFEINFNINYDIALLIMIGITGLYLVLGGYFAITLTDFIQGIIMIAGSLLMVAILVGKAGGLNAAVSKIIGNYSVHIAKQPDMILLASLVFMTSFGTWGLPQMVQKFYAVKNEKVILKATIVTTIFALVIGFAAYFTGSMTHVFFDAPIIENGKPVFDKMIPDLLKINMPEILMAIILLLILSASMSTLSSLILVSASSIAIDLYKGHVNPNISKENSLIMMRFLSAVFVAFSYFIARFQLSVIVTLMSLSWGAVAGSFTAAYVYGLYWKKTTKPGVYAGMFTGLFLSIFLFYYLKPAKSPIASSIAIIAPFIVIPIVSLFTKPPKDDVIKKAFG